MAWQPDQPGQMNPNEPLRLEEQPKEYWIKYKTSWNPRIWLNSNAT
jgi:hypothetical protein